jgi:cobalt-zinc-cadmium efflux system membrane fusion protein
MKKQLLILLAAAAWAGSGCHREEAATDPIHQPKVEGNVVKFERASPQLESIAVESVKPRTNLVSHFTGRLVWNDESTVRVYTPFAGRVVRVMHNVSDVVEAGETLATIASPDFGQAQAADRNATFTLVQSQKTVDRLKLLFEHGVAAQKDVESAQGDFDRASAEKQRASALLAQLGGVQTNVDELFHLKAPIRGVLVEKNISAGMEARPDAMMANLPQYTMPVFVVSDPTKLWLLVDITEDAMDNVVNGEKIRFTSNARPGREFFGVIDVVGDTLYPDTRTLKVRASVENPDRLLKNEMYVNVDIVHASVATLIEAPSKAVFSMDKKDYVFVETTAGEFERRPVVLGSEDRGKILITGGLHAGDRVVTEGSLLLQALFEGEKS